MRCFGADDSVVFVDDSLIPNTAKVATNPIDPIVATNIFSMV
jgi:hypothetical protein